MYVFTLIDSRFEFSSTRRIFAQVSVLDPLCAFAPLLLRVEKILTWKITSTIKLC